MFLIPAQHLLNRGRVPCRETSLKSVDLVLELTIVLSATMIHPPVPRWTIPAGQSLRGRHMTQISTSVLPIWRASFTARTHRSCSSALFVSPARVFLMRWMDSVQEVKSTAPQALTPIQRCMRHLLLQPFSRGPYLSSFLVPHTDSP